MMIQGIGTDIVEIKRIRAALDRWGEAFIRKIYTDEEVAYVSGFQRPAQHYAVRFAAKEAVYKAIGDSQLSWKDISIGNHVNGKPFCSVPKHDHHFHIHLSLSHSHEYAVANAVVEKRSERP